MLVQETFVNETEGCRFGSGEPYVPFTDDFGRLFRDYQKEYGRCTGKVYVDTEAGTKTIGWVFQKREKYTDCDDTYLQSTWVTVYKKYEKKTVIDCEYLSI